MNMPIKQEAMKFLEDVELTPGVLAKDRVPLLGFRGSISHGTYIPPENCDSIDDIDLIGVAVMPIDYYLGLKKFETREIKIEKWDIVIYDIRHFFRLLLKQNPNVNSLLWLRPQMYLNVGYIGRRIIDERELFISKEMFFAYEGYAKGQLHRMSHSCAGSEELIEIEKEMSRRGIAV